MDECIDAWMHGCMHEWMHASMLQCMDARMGAWFMPTLRLLSYRRAIGTFFGHSFLAAPLRRASPYRRRSVSEARRRGALI